MRAGESADGEAISQHATLAEALGTMTEQRRDRLSVADGEGRIVGVITLADLVR
jgi:CBS domain-containing protein